MLQLVAILLMISPFGAVDYNFVHPRCTDTCSDQGDGQYLDCNRCDRFVSCSGSKLYRMRCPELTSYHGYLGVCVHATSPNCSPGGYRDPPLTPGEVIQQTLPTSVP
ncbi:unnamed protein product, partial [Candidula unifasciata]